MVKRFIIWYLKRHNVQFEYKDYTVRMFSTGYYSRLMGYANMMDGVNCRCYTRPIFDHVKEAEVSVK